MITTFCSSSRPSISARMVLTTRSVTCGSPRPPPRAGTRLSSSSKKMIVGATCRARLNRRAICCSLSPYHLLKQVRRFGGDEVRFALARRGLGEQGLAGPGRAVQEEALGGPDAETAEGLRVLQRKLDAFAQAALRLIETADVVPADDRCIDHDFAHCRRLHAFQRIVEVARLDRERVEDLGGIVSSEKLIFGMIRRTASARPRGSAPPGPRRRSRGCGAPRSSRLTSGGQRHAAGVDRQDLAPAGLSGTPMTISRSKRPGRRSASSRASGRLVAAMTTDFAGGPQARPSGSAAARPGASRPRRSPGPRLGAIESISSMKMMDGAALAASSKISRRLPSLSP